MKARPVIRRRDGTIAVPLSRGGKAEAVLYTEDYDELMSLGVYPNWCLRGGNVASSGPNGLRVLVGRVLLDAKPGTKVAYLDGDTCNLRRKNLILRKAWSEKHDRALLLARSASEAPSGRLAAM